MSDLFLQFNPGKLWLTQPRINNIAMRICNLCDSGETAFMIGSTTPSAFDSRVFMVAPFNGLPCDFLRFERDLNIRLAREYIPGTGPGEDAYSLQETLEGTDAYGAIFQSGPDALPMPPANVADRREMKKHERRLRTLASHLIVHILDENLKSMIQAQEAEIYSYTYAAKDLRFIQQLLQFNGHDITLPTAILTDSSSAVPWIRNPGSQPIVLATSKSFSCMAYGRDQFLNKVSVLRARLDQQQGPMR